MPIQTQRLVMIALGAQHEEAPHTKLQRIADGIHLRWAFGRGLGFPDYGFYLFRREHRKPEKLACLKDARIEQRGADKVDVEFAAYGVFARATWRKLRPHTSIPQRRVWQPRADFTTEGPNETLEFVFHTRTFTLNEEPAPLRRIKLTLKGGPAVITTSLWERDIARYEIPAGGGTIEIEADAITALRIVGDALRVTALCILPVSAGAAEGWEAIPGLSYPITLPLTHPDYPAASAPENLDDARRLCRDRIHYREDDTARVREMLSPAPRLHTDVGRISVDTNSMLVIGRGTEWKTSLSGGVLRVAGETTGYTILRVIGPEKLLLTRPHSHGASEAHYRIDEDPTGQLHDTLALLVDGGSAAVPMPQRVLPLPVLAGGYVQVEPDAENRPRKITSNIGAFSQLEIEGLALRLVDESRGRVDVTAGSERISGGPLSGWSAGLVGQEVWIGSGDSYQVAGVDTATGELVLSAPYRGSTESQVTYAIFEPFSYRIERVTSAQELYLAHDYIGSTRVWREFIVTAPLGAEGSRAPAVPQQRPLELILTAALHPGIAQMLGLAWVDGERHGVKHDERYDYLIMADHDGTIGDLLSEMGGAEKMTQALISNSKMLALIDGWIVFDRGIEQASPLAPPAAGETFALPARPTPAGEDSRRQNIAGLRWGRLVAPGKEFAGLLGSEHAVLYHLWRQRLKRAPDPQYPPYFPPSAEELAEDELVTPDYPLVATRAPNLRNPSSGWPAFGLDHLDLPLADGWYTYRLSGMDIFGRHTAVSQLFRWCDFDPGDEVPGEVRNPFAVLLRNNQPPGAPTGVEAFTLDPRDPFIVRDKAYRDWRAGLNRADVETRVGLRIEWRWTEQQARIAHDVTHFCIYYQPGRLNAFLGRVTAAIPLDVATSEVLVVLEHAPTERNAPNTLRDAWLRRGPDAFRIVGNDVNNNGAMRLLVAHDAPVHALGEIITVDGPRLEGRDTSWTDELVSGVLSIAGELHRIVSVDSPTHLTLESVPSGIGDGGYEIFRAPASNDLVTVQVPEQMADGTPHLAHVGYRSAESWQQRLMEVQIDDPRGQEIVEPALSSGGSDTRVRTYTVFLDAPSTEPGGAFHTTLAQPSVYANLGVSAVDERGNESEVGGPARVVRVLRETPPAPAAPLPREEKVFATPADYHSRSFYTFRWPTPANSAPYGVLVYRAMERSVFRRDLLSRQTHGALNPDDRVHARQCFPSGLTLRDTEIARQLNLLVPKSTREAGLAQYRTLLTHDDHWRVLAVLPGNEGVASLGELRSLTQSRLTSEERDTLLGRLAERDYDVRISRTALTVSDAAFSDEPRWNDLLRLHPDATEQKTRAEWVAEALNAIETEDHYWSLPLREDAWQVLANLPGNEMAFLQVTPEALDSADPETANRRGPDDPADFNIGVSGDPMADPGLRAYIDTLDGRSRNAYLYRARYVDPVQNRGAFGPASRPVHLPVVEPPRAPKPTKVLGGDRHIIVRLAPTREPHAIVYAVYRSDDPTATRDLRLMGEPIAHLLVHPRVVRGAAIEFDPRVEAAVVERVYAAAGFDPTVDLLTQLTAQLLDAPVEVPVEGITSIEGINAVDGTEVVIVYRDRASGLQYTPWRQRPREWADHAVTPLRNQLYCIVAVGSEGQRSPPSKVLRGRAFDEQPLIAPTPTAAWTTSPSPVARVVWSAEHETLLERARGDGVFWRPVGDWLPPGNRSIDDAIDSEHAWRYRLRARKPAGLSAPGETVFLAALGASL